MNDENLHLPTLEAAAAAICGGCAGSHGILPARFVKGVWWHDWPGAEPPQKGFTCYAAPIQELIAKQRTP